MTSPGISPTVLDPRDTMKTHVQEMGPAQRLAEHDRRARLTNEGKAEEAAAAPKTFEVVTVSNLCGIALDVVKELARQGFDASTVTVELVEEKVLQRFPNGVKLAPDPEPEIVAADEDAEPTDERDDAIVEPDGDGTPPPDSGTDVVLDSDAAPKPSAPAKAKKTPKGPKPSARAPKGPKGPKGPAPNTPAK
jgi:hypothetical protein